MSDVALIMALPNESKGLFEQAGIEVHYSGIGKVNAAYKAFEVIQKTGCKTLINLGTAGSTYFDKHELVEVSQFYNATWMSLHWVSLSALPHLTPYILRKFI